MSNTQTLDFILNPGEYLSDTGIKEILLENIYDDGVTKTLVKSNTGTGKSYMFIEVIKNIMKGVTKSDPPNNDKKIIMALPTNLATDDLYMTGLEHLQDKGDYFGVHNIMKSDKSNRLSDLLERGLPPFTVCTHAQMKNIVVDMETGDKNLLYDVPNLVLIVDEVHSLVTDSYRANSNNILYNMITGDKINTVICLTATPRPLDFIREGIKFTHKINVIQKDPRVKYRIFPIDVVPVTKDNIYNPPGYKDHVYRKLLSEHVKGTITAIFYTASKVEMRAMKILAEERGYKVIIMNADTKKESSYIDLKSKNMLPEDTDIFIFNGVAKEGVNILNENVSSVYYMNSEIEEDIKQSCARFRYEGCLDVHVLNFLVNKNKECIGKKDAYYLSTMEMKTRNKNSDNILTVERQLDTGYDLEFVNGVWEINELLHARRELKNQSYRDFDLTHVFEENECEFMETETITTETTMMNFGDNSIKKQSDELRESDNWDKFEMLEVVENFLFDNWEHKLDNDKSIIYDFYEFYKDKVDEKTLSKTQTRFKRSFNFIERNFKNLMIFTPQDARRYLIRIAVDKDFRQNQRDKLYIASKTKGISSRERELIRYYYRKQGDVIYRPKGLSNVKWNKMKKDIGISWEFKVVKGSVHLIKRTEKEHKVLTNTERVRVTKVLLPGKIVKKLNSNTKPHKSLELVIDPNFKDIIQYRESCIVPSNFKDVMTQMEDGTLSITDLFGETLEKYKKYTDLKRQMEEIEDEPYK